MLTYAKSAYEQSPPLLRKLAWIIPQPFLLSRSYWRMKKQLTYGREIDREQQQSLQAKLLSNALCYALKNVPFYRSSLGRQLRLTDVDSDPFSALKEFPVISKDDLRDNLNDFVSRNIDKRSRYLATTGGSTGAPLQLWLANSVWATEWAFVFDLLANYGITPSDSRVSLRGVRRLTNSDAFYEENPLYREIRLSPFKLTHANLPEISLLIKNIKPRYIHGYPSAVRDLLVLLGDDSREVLQSVRVILLVSENLPSGEAEYLARISGVPIASFYGHTERACFAPWVESCGIWVPHWLYGVTELYRNRIVATGFINPAMPLIRYDTGDVVAGNETDRILNPGDGFTAIEGRWSQDFMIGRSGQKITMTALNTHIPAMRWVRKFQFFQENKGEAILRLMMVDQSNQRDVIALIQQEFQRKCGDELKVTPLVVDDIPLSRLGKHAFIIRVTPTTP